MLAHRIAIIAGAAVAPFGLGLAGVFLGRLWWLASAAACHTNLACAASAAGLTGSVILGFAGAALAVCGTFTCPIIAAAWLESR